MLQPAAQGLGSCTTRSALRLEEQGHQYACRRLQLLLQHQLWCRCGVEMHSQSSKPLPPIAWVLSARRLLGIPPSSKLRACIGAGAAFKLLSVAHATTASVQDWSTLCKSVNTETDV